MKCDSRTIGREHSTEFAEVTADLNKILPLITKRMIEHNLLE